VIEIMKPIKVKRMSLAQIEKRMWEIEIQKIQPRYLSFRFGAVDIGVEERPRCLLRTA
jgi:hypothetical protein